MATAARKARKRAGIKFEKTAKAGTPLAERAWYAALIPQSRGDNARFEPGALVARSAAKRLRALAARTEVAE